MTGLDLAQCLKDELNRLAEEVSRLARRRAVLGAAATKLRCGYAPAVVLAEIRAAGEDLAHLPLTEEWR